VPKVLIIEDDDVIAEGMAKHLSSAGFEPLWVGAGEPGLARLRYEHPDVCVLDLMLPGLDGWKLIETARAEGIGTPIVVVSARGTEHDRVHALEIGADDYLVKPFSMKELVARVQVAARRGVRGRGVGSRSSSRSYASTRSACRPTWTARVRSSRRPSFAFCTHSRSSGGV
jgi:two-component system OmpR family response regulator